MTMEKEREKDHIFTNVRMGGQSSPDYKKGVEKFDQMHNMCLEHYYLSPEVVSGAEYTQKADLYALGVMFIELATLTKKPEYSPYTYMKLFGSPITPD